VESSENDELDFCTLGLATEERPGTGFWWLSFADGSLPKGQQFLGAALVRGYNIISATSEAHRIGCNPGGEVQGTPVPPYLTVPDEYRGRLLSRAEAEELDRIWTQ
jgi:hypothetical protein